MKKLAASTKEVKVADQVTQQGCIKRSTVPVNLIQAKQFLLLTNFSSLAHTLDNQLGDSATIERDFILALSNYAQQAYKQFYLVSMGLVAGCKAELESLLR